MIGRARPWLPAVVVPALIAVGSVAVSTQAGAEADLPDRSPAEILALIGESDVETFSGTFEQTSDLGLPQLPAGLGGPPGMGSDSAVLELLTSPHTVRVYSDGPTRMRVQVIERFAERNLVRNGPDVWFYDSSENTATHLTVPDGEGDWAEVLEGFKEDFHDGEPATEGEAASGAADKGESAEGDGHAWPWSSGDGPWAGSEWVDAQSPEEVAELVLAELDSSTQVTAGAETEIAGRPAYSLVMTPLSQDTLVASVTIDADAETGMPLSVVVRARGQESPAYAVTFTSLSLEAPDPALFAFSAPPGATVDEPTIEGLIEELTADVEESQTQESAADDPAAEESTTEESTTDESATDESTTEYPAAPSVHGTAWDTVIEIPSGAESVLLSDPILAQALDSVAGGKVLSTSLVNVLLTDDGRTLVGSVTVERLLSVAEAQ